MSSKSKHKEKEKPQAEGLRSKFKATNIDTLKNTIKDDDVSLGKKGDFIKLVDGKNRFRLYPKFPEDENFYIKKVVHWLELEADEGDKDTKRRSVYNAKVHGGVEKDIIEEYIDMVKKKYADSDDDEAETKMKTLTDKNKGLLSSTVWLCYANKLEKSC